MASLRIPALRHLAVHHRLRIARVSSQRRWAQVHDLRFLTTNPAQPILDKYREKLDRKARQEGPFTAFAVEGPLDFSLTGVLSTLLAPLTASEIPVFTISTFDTDWILVPAARAEDASQEWRRAGHAVRAVHAPTDTSSGEGTP